MIRKYKNKILVLGLVLITLVGLFSPTVKAQTITYYGCSKANDPSCPRGSTCDTRSRFCLGANGVAVTKTINTPAPTSTTNYQLLAPLPCDPNAVPRTPGCDSATKTIKTLNTTTGLGAYLNLMIKIFIGICAVLSVVMIVMGGVEYMTSELVHSKEAGKEKIIHALLGLIIALGAYALLYTINPDLLKSDINVPNAVVTVPADAKGTCVVTVNYVEQIYINTTKAECGQLVGRSNSYEVIVFISWTENPK